MSLMNLTGKDKASLIPLGYHGKVGSGRVKVALWVAGISLALMLVAGALGFWKHLAVPLRPVHSAHAAWESDCATCHEPMKPASSGNALGFFSGYGKTSDKLCMNCHMGYADKQAHHANIDLDKTPALVGSCASCHADHQGRAAFISRVSDARCTCCHQDLSKHVTGGKTQYENVVTSFQYKHPEFKVHSAEGGRAEVAKAKDPGKLRFNHKLHLAKDLVSTAMDKVADKDLRERYRKAQGVASDEALAEMACAVCHVMDPTDDGRKSPARASGDYVQPVNFDRHCKACHPLTFSASTELKDLEIPHHLQPAQVKEFLAGAYARTLAADKAAGKGRVLVEGYPLPGDNLPFAEREKLQRDAIKKASDTKAERLFAWERQAEKAGRYTLEGAATCGLCHHKEDGPSGKAEARIMPTAVPEVWYEHGKFSHRAHRDVKCLSCHGKDENPNLDRRESWRVSVLDSRTEGDVLLPGRNNCLECHASRSGNRGGIRHECVTCHSYHHADKPLSGRGAAGRGVPNPVSIDDLLRSRFGK